MLHLSSFALSSFVPVLRATGWSPDVVFNVEPTFFSAPVALLAAYLAEAPAWLHVQDFEVDAAFDLGLLPADGALHTIALRLEAWFTQHFDRVSTISPRMGLRAVSKGVPASRVVLFPNWVDPSVITPLDSAAPSNLRRQLGLGGEAGVALLRKHGQ